MAEWKNFSRGTDHIGFISNQLKDLTGYKTLANELIQNADDAKASKISFNITENALIVINNGIFSKCSNINFENPKGKCLMKSGKCDFHGIASVASQHKTKKENTTGTFGIGFLTVYQVTDNPEIISNGEHWIINDLEEESKRIKWTPVEMNKSEGTKIVLPWAKDKDSKMRKALNFQHVTETVIAEIENKFKTLSYSIMFLKNITEIRILINSKLIKKFNISLQENILELRIDDKIDQQFLILDGNFKEESTAFKENGIYKKKKDKVFLAIPFEFSEIGKYYSDLPTEHETKLPFHIQADFFPSNDRKHIKLENDIESEWNKAAIKTAAKIFSDNLHVTLSKLNDDSFFWGIIQIIYNRKNDFTLNNFWDFAFDELKKTNCIPTVTGIYDFPINCKFIPKKDLEIKFYDELLKKLEIPSITQKLSEFHNLFITLGSSDFKLKDLLMYVSTSNLDFKNYPNLIEALWIRLSQSSNPPHEEFIECKIFPTLTGEYENCKSVFYANDDTSSLFFKLDHKFNFLAKPQKSIEFLKVHKKFCNEFEMRNAIDIIKHSNHKKKYYKEIFKWLKNNTSNILGPEAAEIRLLKIFPTSKGLKSASNLTLPGNFTDPFEFAELIDMSDFDINYKLFFKNCLKIEELNICSFIEKYIPNIFEHLDSKIKNNALQFLKNNFQEFIYSENIINMLKTLKLIEVDNSEFIEPELVYFNNSEIKSILQDSVKYISETNISDKDKDFYLKLGVNDRINISDIIQKIEDYRIFNNVNLKQIRVIFKYLGKIYNNNNKEDFNYFKKNNWIPAYKLTSSKEKRNLNEFYLPSELLSPMFEYQCWSNGIFADIERSFFKKYHDFILFLGFKQSSSVNEIIQHLEFCSNKAIPLDNLNGIYQRLNQSYNDYNIDKLKKFKSLFLNKKYYYPIEVFWDKTPFGKYVIVLSDEYKKYYQLFNQIGVKETPDFKDAIRILKKISEQKKGRRLTDNEINIVSECWSLIQKSLKDDSLSKNEIETNLNKINTLVIIPDNQKMLSDPSCIFFEDRPSLADYFGKDFKSSLITKNPSNWEAMALAGVKNLSDAVSVKISNIEKTSIDSVQKRINFILSNSSQTLKRLFIGHYGNKYNVDDIVNLLEKIKYISTSELQVEYKIELVYNSFKNHVSAFYDNEDSIIYFHFINSIPWIEISTTICLDVLKIEDKAFIFLFNELLISKENKKFNEKLDTLEFDRISSTNPHDTIDTEFANYNDTSDYNFGQDIEPEDAMINLISKKYSVNSESRKEKVKNKTINSPAVTYEKRKRTIRTSQHAAKELSKISLENEYYDVAAETSRCQMCYNLLSAVSFKKVDGSFFFRNEPIIGATNFTKETDYPYLHLCPLCAEKYSYARKSNLLDEKGIKTQICHLKENQYVEIDIAAYDQPIKIYFSSNHILGLHELFKYRDNTRE